MPRLLAGLLMLLFASAARADDAEDKAVEVVEKLGGKVTRDEKKKGKPVVGLELRKPRGFNAFGFGIGLADSLKTLAALKDVTTLDASDWSLGDDGVKELVQSFPNLTELNLHVSSVTGKGLKELAALKGLTTLAVSSRELKDADLAELAALKGLTNLDLRGFAGVPLTDKAVKEVAQLKQLTTLNLGINSITNTGAKQLAALKDLADLDLSHTEVTEKGRKELQKALPKCKIVR